MEQRNHLVSWGNILHLSRRSRELDISIFWWEKVSGMNISDKKCEENAYFLFVITRLKKWSRNSEGGWSVSVALSKLQASIPEKEEISSNRLSVTERACSSSKKYAIDRRMTKDSEIKMTSSFIMKENEI